MQRIFVFFAVIGMCIGCSGSQGSAPDYEVRSEQDKSVSNLKVKTVEVYTDSIKEKELRRIAEDIKHLRSHAAGLEIIRFWRTTDLRPGRDDTTWLNVLLRKK